MSAPLPANSDLRSKDELVLALVLAARFPDEPVALGAQLIDLVKHSRQQFFRGLRADTRALEIEDFLPLPHYLPAALFDVRSNELKIHGLALFARKNKIGT
ncbi:hypothetical protein [Bradyrhizobium sp. UNPF46]|uniref:hypothetical protein n=1 Tax=Bradyrhizobium sp. UNPF46 TaxID=1141168 RepID=UPI0015F10BA9|nr:hypothetical protein [Bradyrhizobium sp. UNPF46]